MRNSIFCNEPIIAVYHGRPESPADDGLGAFLDCYTPNIAIHLAPENRIVLETEHNFISIESTGVTLAPKTETIEQFEKNGEWLFPYYDDDNLDEDETPWVYYTATMFDGEHLLAVVKTDTQYMLKFDDFDVTIIPHDDFGMDFPTCIDNRKSYHRIYGADRHIKRKCACGGEGELLLDFVSDYVVRCKECKCYTWGMCAIDAIQDWNAGYTDGLLHND